MFINYFSFLQCNAVENFLYMLLKWIKILNIQIDKLKCFEQIWVILVVKFKFFFLYDFFYVWDEKIYALFIIILVKTGEQPRNN